MVRINTLITALLLCVSPLSWAQSEGGLVRGKLLYTTHCMSCHTSVVHWRAKKQVTNWSSLGAQVDRWQKAAGLGWSGEEIEEVSSYLNQTYYHFPMADRIGQGPLEMRKTGGDTMKRALK